MTTALLYVVPPAIAAYIVYTVVYTLFFHPLAKFPGLKQSAFSDRWLYYASKRGKVEVELEELHKKFGDSTHIILLSL